MGTVCPAALMLSIKIKNTRPSKNPSVERAAAASVISAAVVGSPVLRVRS
jgi:hypothetical protein